MRDRFSATRKDADFQGASRYILSYKRLSRQQTTETRGKVGCASHEESLIRQGSEQPTPARATNARTFTSSALDMAMDKEKDQTLFGGSRWVMLHLFESAGR